MTCPAALSYGSCPVHSAASLLAPAIARAVHVTRAFDWLYRSADRARSEPSRPLPRTRSSIEFNDIAYAGSRSYQDPDASSFRAYLLPWEEAADPALLSEAARRTVLVGGAGGGREALALVNARLPRDRLRAVSRACRGARQPVRPAPTEPRRLPRPIPRPPASRERYAGREGIELHALPAIDAAIAGWGSFSHLRTHELRVAALESFAQATPRPSPRQLSRPLQRRAGTGLISRTTSARASSPSGTQARPTSSPSTSASTTARASRRSKTSPRPPASRSCTRASTHATPTGLTSCFGARRADETEPVPRPPWFRARRLG